MELALHGENRLIQETKWTMRKVKLRKAQGRHVEFQSDSMWGDLKQKKVANVMYYAISDIELQRTYRHQSF